MSKYMSSGKLGFFSTPGSLEVHTKSSEDTTKKRITRERRQLKPTQDDQAESRRGSRQATNDVIVLRGVTDEEDEERAFMQACERKLKQEQAVDTTVETSPDTASPCQDTLTRYMEACSLTQTCPLSTFIRQIGARVVRLRNALLRPPEVKAVCIALMNDEKVEHVDMSGNHLGVTSSRYLSQLLSANTTLTDLTVRDNKLCGPALMNLLSTVRIDNRLTRIDLSGNKLKDVDSPYLASLINNNNVLEYLDLSNNELSELTGNLIGNVLARNTTLRELDLSWNHLRYRGAVDICRAVKYNTGLLRLNVDWNGFAYEGAAAMGDALCHNSTLIELDMAYNRIHHQGLLQMCKGLLRNKSLVFLNLSHNPLWSVHLQVLICGIRDSPHMALKYLDLGGLVIESEFMDVVQEIQKRSTFSVIYGAILPVSRAPGVLTPLVVTTERSHMDPAQILQYLKDKMRVIDLFWKIDKDSSTAISRAELHHVIENAGIPVTCKMLDDLMGYMDTDGNGLIDMSEFFDADRRSRRKLRGRKERYEKMKEDKYTQYTEGFMDMGYRAQTRDVVKDREGDVLVQRAVESLHKSQSDL